MTVTTPLDQQCINTLRFLSVNMVQKANSGHSGLPLGALPMAYVPWTRWLWYNPRDPHWFSRDRVLLSAGDGSALHCRLLHLTSYELSLHDIPPARRYFSPIAWSRHRPRCKSDLPQAVDRRQSGAVPGPHQRLVNTRLRRTRPCPPGSSSVPALSPSAAQLGDVSAPANRTRQPGGERMGFGEVAGYVCLRTAGERLIHTLELLAPAAGQLLHYGPVRCGKPDGFERNHSAHSYPHAGQRRGSESSVAAPGGRVDLSIIRFKPPALAGQL
jgi:hypothetical protein